MPTATYNEPDLTYNSLGTYNFPTPDAGFVGGVGIELYIFDKLDPASLVDVIPQRYSPTYLEELRGPGGGSFTISKSDPRLVANPSLLDYRNIVRVYVDGALRGAWIITKKSEVLVGQGELADQAYQVSGPGLRAWAADSVVYPLAPPGRLTKPDRTFSFASPRGSWYDPAAWVPVVQMSRQDSQRLLLASFFANAVVPGLVTALDDDGNVVPGTAPKFSPDGKPQRPNGFIIAGMDASGSVGGYQLYGSNAGSAASYYWWDAAGFHPVQTLAAAPDTDPLTGATKYPKLIGPGYVAYVLVDPVTGVWDSSTDANNLDFARHRYFNGDLFVTTTNPYISDVEIAPPSWSEVNPWKFGPKDWPTGFAPHARWIWSQESRAGATSPPSFAPAGDVYFRREFTLPAAPGALSNATRRYALSIAADNAYKAYLDGEMIGDSSDQDASFQSQTINLDLAAGDHILAVKVTNWETGTAGLLCAFQAYGDASSPTPSNVIFVSDTTSSYGGQWLCDPYPVTPPGWTPGEVLLTLLAEAQVRGVTTALNLIPTFTTTTDTYGNAWDRSVDWSFGIGTEYGDVITKIEEIKADFFFDPQRDGTVLLHAYTSRGIDRSSQVVVVNDSFSRTVSSAWGTTDSGESWTVAGGVAADYNVGSGVGTVSTVANGSTRMTRIVIPSADVDAYISAAVPVTVTGTQGLIAFLTVRETSISTTSGYCSRLDFTPAGQWQARLYKRVAGVETLLGTITSPAAYTANTFIRTRIQVVGSTVRAKAWVASTIEPSAWAVTVDDNDFTVSGNIGIRSVAITGNTSSDPRILYDDMVISTVPNDFLERQPVVFRPGHNVTTATEDNEFTLVKNSLLTASTDGWANPDEPLSQLAYGRVEGYLNVPGTAAMASQVASATLLKLGLSQDATTVGFEPFEDHMPWVNFTPGDLVQAPTTAVYGSGGQLTPRRIMSLAFSEDQDTSRVLYAAEFGTINRDRQERIERWLQSVGGGTLGGSVANATTNNTVTGSTPVSSPNVVVPTYTPVVVNPVLIGQVISGANIMPGSIVASDKMVANSITANSAIIANAAINSAQIESLQANKISAGTIMAELALAGRIATSLTGARAEMNSSGFHAFNFLNQEVFTADNVGNVFLAGKISTGIAPQPRVEIADGFGDLQTPSFGSANNVFARMAMYTGAVDERTPGLIASPDFRDLGFMTGLAIRSASHYDYINPGTDFTAAALDFIPQTAEFNSVGFGFYLAVGDSPDASSVGSADFADNISVRVFRGATANNGNPAFAVGDIFAGTLYVAMDYEGVQAQDGSNYQPLNLQKYGHGVRINSTGAFDTPLPASTAHPLQIGATSSSNLRFGTNAIFALNNGSFATLLLGGDNVSVGAAVALSVAGAVTQINGGALVKQDLTVNGASTLVGTVQMNALVANGTSALVGTVSANQINCTGVSTNYMNCTNIITDQVSFTTTAAPNLTFLTVSIPGMSGSGTIRAFLTADSASNTFDFVAVDAETSTSFKVGARRASSTSTNVNYVAMRGLD